MSETQNSKTYYSDDELDDEYKRIIPPVPMDYSSYGRPSIGGKILIPFLIRGKSYPIPKLLRKYELSEAYDRTLSDGLADHGAILLPEIHCKRGSAKASGRLIGQYRGPSRVIKMVPCRKTFREILDLSTSCQNAETSNSSPSFILHQICSLAFLFSLPDNASVVFEDNSTIGQPDLRVDLNGDFYVEVTGDNLANKMEKYPGPMLVLNKYDLIQFFDENSFLRYLTHLSHSCDKRDGNAIQEIMSRQNVTGRPLLYDDRILHFLQNSPDSTLDQLSSIATSSIKNHLILESAERKPYSLDFTRYAKHSNFDWINFEIRSTGRRSSENVDYTFEIDNDQLKLSIEEEDPDRQEYFKPVDSIIMDLRSVEAMRGYRSKLEWQIAAEMDLFYSTEILPKLNPRSGKYYKRTFSSKLATGKHGDYVIKESRQVRGLSSIETCLPRNNAPCRRISDSLRNWSPLPIDPIDEEIMSPAGSELREWFTKSKIYHILRIFQKCAQSVISSARDITGRKFIIEPEWSSLKAHLLVTGNPVEQDKGMVYVSLIDNDELIKTWCWRSSDLKHYTKASTALVSSVCGMYQEADGRKMAAMDLYSLLLLENSWGVSKILKVFRYLSTGILYDSPLVHKQAEKLRKAISENEVMVKRKMSLTFLFHLLKNQSRTGTPLFGFDKGALGYEIFLVNLCPSDTYGSRKHRVDVTKEFMSEIKLWEEIKSKPLNDFQSFHYLLKFVDESDWNSVRRVCDQMAIQLLELSKETKGRFTITPLALLALWRPISKLRTSYGGTCPRIEELMTMKASFDPLRFEKCSALQSISRLCQKEDKTTTASLCISILSRVIDLTFRMFDKAQVGGNREISILSSEFRILQAITESFSKKLGLATGIDMLDNPAKVDLLAKAHNLCRDGYRLTADQTRWGPNFNTSLFGYMFALFSRLTTEAFVPMVTCFLGELKIFEAVGYSELWEYQIEGYTLPGRFGQSHMGQGIYHYTSSLWHSLVSQLWSELVSKSYESGTLKVICFCTSDDVAQFFCLNTKLGQDITQGDKRRMLTRSLKYLEKYPSYLQFFSILTSDYKNLISRESVEFNSNFLNPESVGSNSLKFLVSLIDPYTSGNKLRDLNNIWDTFSDAINSGLSVSSAEFLTLSLMKIRCLQWNVRSDVLLQIIRTFRSQQKERPNSYELPLLLSGKCIGERSEDVPECATVLPFRRYAEYVKGLEDYISMLKEETQIQKSILKLETLSKAKARRLSSNKGLVLSRSLRERSKILLPVDNPMGAIYVSTSAYLAYCISRGGAHLLFSPTRAYQQTPNSTRRESSQGIHPMILRSSRLSTASLDQLVVSSYEPVRRITPNSDSLHIFLHMSRNKGNLRMNITSELNRMSFAERIKHFDEVISLARIVGNAKALTYFDQVSEYTSYTFEDISGVLNYFPIAFLPKPEQSLIGLESDNPGIWALRYSKSVLNGLQSGRRVPIAYSEMEFTINADDLLRAAIALLETEESYSSSSGRSDTMYLNIDVMRREIPRSNKFSDEEIEVNEGEEFEEYLLRVMESVGMSLKDLEEANEGQADLSETEIDDFDFLGGNSFSLRKSVISFQIRQRMSILSEDWFVKEMKRNAILGRMIREQFVQMQVGSNPYLMWSVIGKYRTAEPQFSDIYGPRGSIARMSFQAYLNSLFDIKKEVYKLSRNVYLPSSVSPNTRVLKMLEAQRDPSKLDLDAIGPLPIGMSITSKPLGPLIDPTKIKSIEDLNEYISFPPTGTYNPPLRESREVDYDF